MSVTFYIKKVCGMSVRLVSDKIFISKDNMERKFYLVLVVFFLSVTKGSLKKYEAENGGFQPSQVRYYETNLPNKPSKQVNASSKLDLESKESDRLRFGVPLTTTYGNTGVGGYGNGVGYVMNPVKIDLGGIALGALIGLGAILIVPKLAHIFGGTLGSYRSVENEVAPFTEILAKIDNSLEQQNIDSSSCMQRIICTYVSDAQKSMLIGEANTVDEIIYSLTNNNIFTYMLDGSTVKQAIDMGKKAGNDDCSKFYPKCPVNKDNILQIIDSLLPA